MEREEQTTQSGREKVKGGYFSQMTEASDEPLHLLPSLTRHLFAPVWYFFPPTEEEHCRSGSGDKTKLVSHRVFSASFPSISFRFPPVNSLLGVIFFLYVIYPAKKVGVAQPAGARLITSNTHVV